MNYIKVILVLLLFFACKNNKIQGPKKPDNLLSEDKMVEVIYDMSIISAAKGVSKKLLEKEGVEPESYVYELHAIDSTQFAESNNYYAYDLKIYERIYVKVKRKLQLDKMKFDTIVKEEKREKDSSNLAKRKAKDSTKRRNKKKVDDNKANLNLLKIVDTSQISTRQ